MTTNTPATQPSAAPTELIAAVRKLVKAKGRYHTEQNYLTLVAALDLYDAERASLAQQAAPGAQVATDEQPYGYAVEMPDGHTAFFKADPWAWRGEPYNGLGAKVHDLYTRAALQQRQAPARRHARDGWSIQRVGSSIIVEHASIGKASIPSTATDPSDVVLYHLAETLLSQAEAAPAPTRSAAFFVALEEFKCSDMGLTACQQFADKVFEPVEQVEAAPAPALCKKCEAEPARNGDVCGVCFWPSQAAPAPTAEPVALQMALAEALNKLQVLRRYPNMDFIERDRMLDRAIDRASKALASIASPAAHPASTRQPHDCVQVPRATLKMIEAAMNHMGDKINEIDAVEDEDEAHFPAFDAIQRLLAAPSPANTGEALQVPAWVYSSARDLALSLWRKHYKADSPNFEPLDDLAGVLSQIDNMTTGLERAAPSPVGGSADLTDALHGAIMNIPCKLGNADLRSGSDTEIRAYQIGHRDARHAAAALASRPVALAAPKNEQQQEGHMPPVAAPVSQHDASEQVLYAARYRWLRSNHIVANVRFHFASGESPYLYAEALDEAIDNNMGYDPLSAAQQEKSK